MPEHPFKRTKEGFHQLATGPLEDLAAQIVLEGPGKEFWLLTEIFRMSLVREEHHAASLELEALMWPNGTYKDPAQIKAVRDFVRRYVRKPE